MAKPKLAWLNPAVVTGALVPFAWIAGRAWVHKLGADPVATALNQVGLLALIFLVGSLSCSPLKVAFAWAWPPRVRRTLGLCAFFSALCHFLLYVGLDQGLDFRALYEAVFERPFISIGLAALLLLAPLALTSTQHSLTRLGYPRWRALHRLAYVAGFLGVLHFYLRVKADHTPPILYGSILGLGVALRVAARVKKSRDRRRRASLRAAHS